ncbi:pantetheine-phosphate adenylyltransferase [uncultured Ruminococcus sp.]|jgi:pantetheine-phosphate adenylyltransferase|uniref:pantetheine-phosphate adenylyltransferase n=1 Tax=uncultured Ruminococcus sp. TaxID=165186 RepID=UPI002930CD3B|nr:pantetheine-phosphate adenylyltransferase [uncultured Ruminococcus sp.]
MHSTVICPGSFDPVTLGHIDIITRASGMFDNVIVGVFANGEKHPVFSMEERIGFLQRTVGDIPNVRVIGCDGLLAQCAKDLGASAVVRGLRAVSDFEYEFQMALTNRKLNPELDTVFLASDASYTYLSSSIVKNVAYHGGDITNFVPAEIHDEVFNRIKALKG